MSKLGSIENTADFILAIAGGADINGTWQGRPLVEYYFVETMRRISENPLKISMQKLRLLMEAGADPAPLFQSPYGLYTYENLVLLISARLELLEILFSGKQAREIVRSNKNTFLKSLKQLQTILLQIDRYITEMEMTP